MSIEIAYENFYEPTETPQFIEDYFYWNKRTYIKLSSGPTVYFVVDTHKNICESVRIKEDKDDGTREESSKNKMAYFSISDLVEYPPIYELKTSPMFSFKMTSADGASDKIKPATIDEIVGDLKSRGLFHNANRARDIVTNAIYALKMTKQYRVENQPPYPGFFILNDKFVSTESYTIPTQQQMYNALKTFNDIGEQYGKFRPKLGYVAHWMILAPFSFVIKQQGKGTKINNLFLYGTTRYGKTTIAHMSSFIWCRDKEEQLSSGSNVHSPYQYGKAISQSTFPIIVDEGEGLFNSPDLLNLMKTATHSISARSRFNSHLQRDEEVMALSPVIITANYDKPNDGALGARLDLIKYFKKRLRSDEEKKAFMKKFEPENGNGPLKVFKYIGNYVAAHITSNPKLLEKDWLTLSKILWINMYKLAEIDMPDWMRNFSSPEGVEEAFKDENDHYVSNIKSLIIRNAKVDEYDVETRDTIHHITPRDKAQDVVLRAREPWINYHRPTRGPDANKEFVFIEKSIETDLRQYKKIYIQLDRIAELLGGKVQRKTVNGQKRTVAVFDYEEFLNLF